MTEKEIKNIIEQGETETVEFKQSFTKSVIETVVAFSNSKGGKVLIGINNNSELKGVSLTEETIQKWLNEIKQNTTPQIIPDIEVLKITSITIVIIDVKEYPVKPVNYKSKYFKRHQNSNHLMSLDEISNMHLQTINSSWDYYPDTINSINDIDIEKVNLFIKKYEEKHKTKVDYAALDFLNLKNILRDNKLTYGAYLLFVKNGSFVSDIQIGRFKTDITIIDTLSINDDLFTQLDEIIAFIKKHLMVELVITSKPQHTERYDYPLEAIREIVINMLVHRDYRSSNGSIIKIYDDRIEFYNPGGLYGDLTLENLLNFKYSSQTRNKLIADAFKEIGVIEKYGSGIKRIFTICDNYGVIPPKININENSFEFIL